MPHYVLKVLVKLDNMEPLKKRFQLVPTVFDGAGTAVSSRYDGVYTVGTDAGGDAYATCQLEITMHRDQDLPRAKRYRVELWVWDETPTPAPFDPLNPTAGRMLTDTFRAVSLDTDVDTTKPARLVVEGALEATAWRPPRPRPELPPDE